jgi:hypothetical protein
METIGHASLNVIMVHTPVLVAKHSLLSALRTGMNYARFGVFTAVKTKNAVFWDINPQFVPHRRHITSPLQIPAG